MRKTNISKSARYATVLIIVCILVAAFTGCGGGSSKSGGRTAVSSTPQSLTPDSAEQAPEEAGPPSDEASGEQTPAPSDETSAEQAPEQPPELDYEAFTVYFAQNPIEQAFNAEMGTLVSTYDIVQCFLKYSEIWSGEIDGAYERISELSAGSEKERFESEFIQWKNSYSAELQAKIDEYNANEVTGGTIDSINRGSIQYSFYYEKAKSVFAELYRYDNNYSYVFVPQASGGADAGAGAVANDRILPDGDYFMRLYESTGFYEFEGDTVITAAVQERYSYDDAFVRGLSVGSSIETPNGTESVTELTWYSDTQLQITSNWTLSNGIYGWVLCYPSDAAALRVIRELDIAVPDTAEIIDCTDFEPVTRKNLFELLSLRHDCDVLVTIRDGYAVRVEKYYVP